VAYALIHDSGYPMYPEATQLVLRLVKEYHNGWNYSPGLANCALTKMRLDFVNNGPEKTLGIST
jgi:hypothetical protein